MWLNPIRYSVSLSVTSRDMRRRICLPALPTGLDGHDRRPAGSTLLRHPIAHNGLRWYRNINRLSIAYALQPRLRPRLTLRGRALLRKPRAFGGGDFHPSFRYSYRHSHSHSLQRALQPAFAARGTLPYHPGLRPGSAVSVTGLSPASFSAQRHLTSELLRTL